METDRSRLVNRGVGQRTESVHRTGALTLAKKSREARDAAIRELEKSGMKGKRKGRCGMKSAPN